MGFHYILNPPRINPYCANRNKSRLPFSSAEMFNSENPNETAHKE